MLAQICGHRLIALQALCRVFQPRRAAHTQLELLDYQINRLLRHAFAYLGGGPEGRPDLKTSLDVTVADMLHDYDALGRLLRRTMDKVSGTDPVTV